MRHWARWARRPLSPLFLGTVVGCAPDLIDSPTVTLFVATPDEGRRSCPVQDCEIEGGREMLIVRAAFDGVNTESSDEIDPPSITILENNSTLEGPIDMVAIRVSPRTFESPAVVLPPKRIDDLKVRVVAAQGYEATVEGIRVTRPSVTLIGGCKGELSCQRGVGKATFTAETWVPPDTRAKIWSYIDDEPEGVVSEPLFETTPTGIGRATFALDVPVAGATWQVEVVAGGAMPARMTVELTAPDPLSLSVAECPTGPCELPASARVSLVVTVPEAIQFDEALVQPLVDNVRSPVISIPLTLVEADTRVGVATVALPALGRSVLYQGYVGPFSTNSVRVDLAPATPPP